MKNIFPSILIVVVICGIANAQIFSNSDIDETANKIAGLLSHDHPVWSNQPAPIILPAHRKLTIDWHWTGNVGKQFRIDLVLAGGDKALLDEIFHAGTHTGHTVIPAQDTDVKLNLYTWYYNDNDVNKKTKCPMLVTVSGPVNEKIMKVAADDRNAGKKTDDNKLDYNNIVIQLTW